MIILILLFSIYTYVGESNYNELRRQQNMKGYSLNCIPSLEEIPFDISHKPNAQMLLIVSKNSLSSLKSIENMDLDDHLVFQQDNNVSFDFLQNDDPPQPPKSVHIITQQHFQTPTKKKKSGCVCKKTGCLKLYCECFANGKLCTEECACMKCCNVTENKDQIYNARSFRKNRLHNGEKRCNCKKSNCQKKYCECFNAGISCGPLCNCIGCQNPQVESQHLIKEKKIKDE